MIVPDDDSLVSLALGLLEFLHFLLLLLALRRVNLLPINLKRCQIFEVSLVDASLIKDESLDNRIIGFSLLKRHDELAINECVFA